jgi:hypothetical protein
MNNNTAGGKMRTKKVGKSPRKDSPKVDGEIIFK